MNQFKYYAYLDSHPFTGTRETDFYAKASEAEWLKKHFDNTPKCSQVKNITPGKTYHIHKVEGYGDVSDWYFIDDTGAEQHLADFFFEPAPEEGEHV